VSPTAARKPTRRRRRYHSPLRRKRAAETRERIVTAGTELLRGFAVWNWSALTVRGVAKQAGVNERTVYRHFESEGELRDAVLARLQEQARVDLEGLALEDLQAVTARIFEFVSSFPLEPRTPRDATLRAAGQRQREALLAAVSRAAPAWSAGDRALAAAMLDALWSITTYERLVADWQLDPKEATRGVTWVMGLIQEAIRRGRRPDR
jgi:AcrR family transcriptional regulator